MTVKEVTNEQIHEAVQEKYGRIAENFAPKLNVLDDSASCCDPKSGNSDYCGSDLYDVDLSQLPNDVTGLSLGCGDPIAIASLEAGQTVLDLGSGGGIDCFLAAQRVGPTGHVIGVDMTPTMLEKAKRNKAKLSVEHVEFREGQIEALPVADASVDVIISNCVINLSPDKTAVFREAYRVLKPGGRLAVSDMVTRGKFTAQERADMSAWVGCITGAEDVADMTTWMKDAGFSQISIQNKDEAGVELAESVPHSGSAQIFSARITAVKPEEAA
ncbi:SAM-dependent methyltransferase DSY4148 (UbiE paralog) [hydrothermal vent metagenome]|uniref:Arsenite methyltransferase n=1 Tax=hydrothermal vent metagenome TaxID=652676 RepID=A0A3B0V837_9ZZZZ